MFDADDFVSSFTMDDITRQNVCRLKWVGYAKEEKQRTSIYQKCIT